MLVRFALALLVGLAVSPAAAEAIRSPYLEAPGLRHAVSGKFACPVPPPPVRDLVIEAIYVPGEWNTVVPERAARRRAATKPLHDYLRQLTTMSNRAMQLRGAARAPVAACVLRWMESWARSGALLGNVSWPDGHYERKWSLVTLGMAYLQLHAGEAFAPAPPPAVAQWLRNMAAPLPEQYPDTAARRNNHFYWAGLASIVVGTVLNDRELYGWGAQRIVDGLAAVDGEGHLPLELERGELALHYHAFSASPLVLAAAFMTANGEDTLKLHDGALRRLVGRVLSGLADPSSFEAKTGKTQELVSPGEKNSLGWIEVYYRLTGDAAAEPFIRAMRPFDTIWLGGNISDAFGRPVGAGPVAASPLLQHEPR